MKKMIVSLLLLSSMSAFAVTPETLISGFEIEHNAKCEYQSASMKWCLGELCRYKESYVCQSNDGLLEVKIRVIQTMRPDGSLKKSAKLLSVKDL